MTESMLVSLFIAQSYLVILESNNLIRHIISILVTFFIYVYGMYAALNSCQTVKKNRNNYYLTITLTVKVVQLFFDETAAMA